MKLIITHIENIAFNHQMVTLEANDISVQVHFKSASDFLDQDQVGKEFNGFQKAVHLKVKKGLLGFLKI